METVVKLTPKQNAVIWCLQNGWQLITSSQMPGAIVGCSTHEFHIGTRLFWNLYKLGLIHQTGQQDNFDYKLTVHGKKIKTKPVKI